MSDGDLTTPARGANGAPRRGRPSAAPTTIGRYRIAGVLGQGGMGTVYEAEQDHPRRRVALKVVRPGVMSDELLRRFEFEAHVLARLQHPGIAQVYDAGAVVDEHGERVPFFAMELVRGTSLIAHAEDRGLDVRQRLALFALICDAVGHAHQKGVIHRDLKPGNILVDEAGQPKILDFGIARATDSDVHQTTMHTSVGQIMGTLEYMSPEQLAGDPDEIDTRSDVYALGVIAYELLGRRRPFDLEGRMLGDIVNAIREEEPARLSRIDRSLRGDVETIVGKAMDKDRTRRYPTADALASDVRRFLADEPIAARPASSWYQVRKFARRNKGLVAGLATAFVVLVLGLIGTSIGLRSAIRARNQAEEAQTAAELSAAAATAAKEAESDARRAAEKALGKAAATATFMQEMLHGVDRSVSAGRDTALLEEMMDDAAERIERGDLRENVEAELQLRETIGNVYRRLAKYEPARRMLEPAMTMARNVYADDPVELAIRSNDLALLLFDVGDDEGAERLLLESLAAKRASFADRDDDQIVTALTNVGVLLGGRRDFDGAERFLREAAEMSRRLADGDDGDLVLCLTNLGGLLTNKGEYDEAEQLLTEATAMAQRLFEGDHPRCFIALGKLANLYLHTGENDRAEPLLRESVAIGRRLFPDGHPELAQNLTDLARACEADDPVEAEDLLREVLAMRRQMYPGDDARTVSALNRLADRVRRSGKAAEAEATYREALAMAQRLDDIGHPEIAKAVGWLADLVERRRDLVEAEALWVQAVAISRQVHQGDHHDVERDLYNLALVRKARGDLAGAEEGFRDALAIRQRLAQGDDVRVAQALNSLGLIVAMRGDPAAAEPLLRDALAMKQRLFPTDHNEVVTGLHNVAWVLRARGDLAASEPFYRDAAAMERRLHPDGSQGLAITLFNTATVVEARRGPAAAEPLLREAVQLAGQWFPDGHPRRVQITMGLAECLCEVAWAERADGTQRPAALDKATHAEALVRSCSERMGGDGSDPRRARLDGLLGEAIVSAVAVDADCALDARIARLREAETLLTAAHAHLADERQGDRDRSAQRLERLYELWHALQPEAGMGERAAEWKRAADGHK